MYRSARVVSHEQNRHSRGPGSQCLRSDGPKLVVALATAATATTYEIRGEARYPQMPLAVFVGQTARQFAVFRIGLRGGGWH